MHALMLMRSRETHTNQLCESETLVQNPIWSGMISSTLGSLWIIILLSLIALQPPVQAETPPKTNGSGSPYSYDATQEVTLDGVVLAVLLRPAPAPGITSGYHLLLTTASGPIDVNLGPFGMQGTGAVGVVGGQQIEVTGVMKINTHILIARTLRANLVVYTIRNLRGFPVRPRSDKHVGRNALGGAL